MYLRKNHIVTFFICLFSMTSCTLSDRQIQYEDDIKLDSLLNLYKDSIMLKTDRVINVFSEIQSQIKDSVSSYRVQQILSELYFHAGEIDSALLINERILSFCNNPNLSLRMSQLKAKATNGRGAFYVQIDQIDSAIVYLNESYNLLSNISESQLIPDVCINLADCYKAKGNFPLSGYYYRRALFIPDSLNLNHLYFPIYSGMGRLYQELENFTLSDEYFVQAESYWNDASDYEKKYFANTRGSYYYTTGEYKKALEWFRKAEQIVSAFSVSYSTAIVKANIGEVFLLLNQPDSSYYYLDQAKDIFNQLEINPSLKFYLNGLYASLALHEDDISTAQKILLQPYDTSYISPYYINFHNRRLQELYYKKNDYKNAYQYLLEIESYNDSLRNIKVMNNIAEIDFRYRQDTTLLKKDLQIISTENKASQWQRLTMLSILLFLIILIIVASIVLYRKKIREIQYRKQVSTISSLRMEIIKNRITPHFTFNVLNAIMPAFHQYKELEQPFRLLVQMLRGNLRASEKIAVSLGDEIDLVKSYLQLYAVGNPDKIHVKWDIADDLPMETQIPAMCIQIPVENAVKYAFPVNNNDSFIKIQAFISSDEFHLYIEDNGIGYNSSNSVNESGTGSGLRMLFQTVELLNMKNNRKIIFRIENLPQKLSSNYGTRVILIIPTNFRFGI